MKILRLKESITIKGVNLIVSHISAISEVQNGWASWQGNSPIIEGKMIKIFDFFTITCGGKDYHIIDLPGQLKEIHESILAEFSK